MVKRLLNMGSTELHENERRCKNYGLHGDIKKIIHNLYLVKRENLRLFQLIFYQTFCRYFYFFLNNVYVSKDHKKKRKFINVHENKAKWQLETKS